MRNAAGAFQYLCDRGVDTYLRDGSLRVDPHIFNNRDDIARFLSELDGWLGRGRKQY